MKKALVIVLVVAMMLALTACGNQNLLWGNFTYEHVHISDTIEGYCFDLAQWNEDATGIELKLDNGSTVFLSEGTYMLFSHKMVCPYC